MHTIYHFFQQTCDGSIPPLWRMRPLTLAITLLLLCLPSICVMSKRPYQCCCSRKCTLLLSISQDSGSSVRKHMPNYTLLYCCHSWFWVATGIRTIVSQFQKSCQTTPNLTILPFLARRAYDRLSGDIIHKTWWWLLPKSISVKNKVLKTARATRQFVTLKLKMVELQAKLETWGKNNTTERKERRLTKDIFYFLFFFFQYVSLSISSQDSLTFVPSVVQAPKNAGFFNTHYATNGISCLDCLPDKLPIILFKPLLGAAKWENCSRQPPPLIDLIQSQSYQESGKEPQTFFIL